MQKFWGIFWKAFGAAMVLALVIGGLIGLVSHSPETAYEVVQKTIAVGFGVVGFIGFGVIPVAMYFEDRGKGGEPGDAAE